MRAGVSAGAVGLVLTFGLAPAAMAEPSDLAPHMAVYAMSLANTSLSGGVTGASGRMSYKFSDSCDGWTVESKTVLSFSYNEGDPVSTTWDFITWESKDGLRYRFRERSTRDGVVSEEIEGTARLDGTGKSGIVHYVQPEERAVRLPRGTLFPTDHTLRLLDAAHKNERILIRPVFDGTGTEGPLDVSVILGHEVAANANISPAVSNKAVDASLLSAPSWRMQMAFFPQDSQDGVPDYEVGLRYYLNGVVDEVMQSYGTFSLKGTLEKLEALPKPDC